MKSSCSRLLSPCSSKPSPSKKVSSSEPSLFDNGGDEEEEEEVCSTDLLSRRGEAPNPVDSNSSVAVGSIPSKSNPTSESSPTHPQKGKSVVTFKGKRGVRVGIRHRNRKYQFQDEYQALAFTMGMSIASVFSQVLEKKDSAGEKISADRFSSICISAVKESIDNVFGDRLQPFLANFEMSFNSTLKTLQLINKASVDDQGANRRCYSSERPSSPISYASSPRTHNPPCHTEDFRENVESNSVLQELVQHGQINQQLSCASRTTFAQGYNKSVLSTFEKSVTEQTRSNDLKAFELALSMQRLRLKESQLSLSSDANFLERFKISLGISKASFKEEKLKTQLQEMRYEELLKKCIDCLVTGLLIMSTSLLYGTYIYSYEKLTEVTASCMHLPKDSKSWRWVPNPMASISLGFHMLRCHVVLLSRMLFGVLMILALAYSLLQRATTSSQSMPVTFILLLLGVACGIAGKLCVDTLGGSGFCWLLFWEVLCLLHFFANVFTPALFYILHGHVSVCVETHREKIWAPFWFRRVVFYSSLLFFLPVLCGLMPFASFAEWKQHFILLVDDKLNQVSGES